MSVYILECKENDSFIRDNIQNTKWGKVYGTVATVYDFIKVKKVERNTRLIVPNKKRYRILLEKMNYKEFQDYIFSENYLKKVALIYGNCHTIVISELLNKCEIFTKEYYVYPIKPIHTIKNKDYFKQPVFSYCDLFIHQSIQKNNRYGEEYSSERIMTLLPCTCKIISIPNVYHMPFFLFPQYDEKNELRYHGRTYFFRDKIIDEAYCSNKTIRQIEEEYLRKDRFTEEEVQKSFEKFVEKIEKREQEWNIKISKFITNNIGNEVLFYDVNHPTNYLFKYICKKILEMLFPNKVFDMLDSIDAYTLDAYEMPMLRNVCEFIGISYEDKEIRKNGTKVKMEKMFLKEYINQYCSLIWTNEEIRFSIRIKSFRLWIKLKLTDIPRRFIWILRKVIEKIQMSYKKEKGGRLYENSCNDSDKIK